MTGESSADGADEPANITPTPQPNPKPTTPNKLKRMGIPLVCEYLRNVGVDCFKADVHLMRIIGKDRLGFISSEKPSFTEMYKEIKKLSDEISLWMEQIDYILWAYCAENFGAICTATPNCHKCVVREFCNRR